MGSTPSTSPASKQGSRSRIRGWVDRDISQASGYRHQASGKGRRERLLFASSSLQGGTTHRLLVEGCLQSIPEACCLMPVSHPNLSRLSGTAKFSVPHSVS